MTMLHTVHLKPEPSRAAADWPHPVSLETMELIQQAIAQAVHSLRHAPDRGTADAGRIEYESWLPRSH